MCKADHHLIEEIRSGDDAAFSALYQKYVRLVVSAVARQGVPEREIDDVVQDVFLYLYQNILREAPITNLAGYIWRCAVWRARDYRRRVLLMPSTPSEELDPNRAATSSSPQQELEQAELGSEVLQTLAELSPAYRDIIVLKDLEGLDQQEIAAILSITAGAVRTRLWRARLAFQELFRGKTGKNEE